MKMHGLNNNLIYKTLLCIERDNSSRIPRRKTPSPMYKDNQNEKVMRKTPPKNSTPDRFLSSHRHLTVTTETQEDSANIKSHQQPPNPVNKQRRLMYVIVQGNIAYVRRLQRDNPCIYVTVKPKTVYMFQKQIQAREKAEKLRPRVNRGCQAMIRQETQ
jgi:hypothetical protein